MSHIHLDEAYWCENCQCVIDSSERCSSCATEIGIVPLSQYIAEHSKSHDDDVPIVWPSPPATAQLIDRMIKEIKLGDKIKLQQAEQCRLLKKGEKRK